MSELPLTKSEWIITIQNVVEDGRESRIEALADQIEAELNKAYEQGRESERER